MMMLEKVRKEAARLGACEKSAKMSDWKTASWLFFTPQGREFCAEHDFPSMAMWMEIQKDHDMSEYGIFVDSGDFCRANDKVIALVGNSCGTLRFDENSVVHKIVLMHGAKVHIKASNYVVLLIVNCGGCEVSIDKDETVVVL